MVLTGDIELSGIQNPQNGEATIVFDVDMLTADAHLSVDFAGFGADFSALGASNIMDMDFHIEARTDLVCDESLN